MHPINEELLFSYSVQCDESVKMEFFNIPDRFQKIAWDSWGKTHKIKFITERKHHRSASL